MFYCFMFIPILNMFSNSIFCYHILFVWQWFLYWLIIFCFWHPLKFCSSLLPNLMFSHFFELPALIFFGILLVSVQPWFSFILCIVTAAFWLLVLSLIDFLKQLTRLELLIHLFLALFKLYIFQDHLTLLFLNIVCCCAKWLFLSQ